MSTQIANRVYRNLRHRVYADMDNEHIEFDLISSFICGSGVGLSKSDAINDFSGEKIVLREGDYIYLYMEVGVGESGAMEYVFAEGYILPHPNYDATTPCKWCCKYVGDVEYMEDYIKNFMM
ncbi:hypothetical protein [Escherichia marmotae]|uniref:hypothetical protein n=2 Tax=Escherichia marmotae TaxID=1499973 RepID=UPI0005708B4F|nr:hypothetical protein [Escherichia marmotae]